MLKLNPDALHLRLDSLKYDAWEAPLGNATVSILNISIQLFMRAEKVHIGLFNHTFAWLHSESETSTSLARAACGANASTSSLETSHPFLFD